MSRRLLHRSSRTRFQKAADTRLRHMTSTKVFPALTKGELKSQKIVLLFQEILLGQECELANARGDDAGPARGR